MGIVACRVTHDLHHDGAVNRLVSLALYDPDGRVAPFVRRTIEQLATPGTTLVASATHPLASDDAAWVRERAELVERENVGLDLYGHRLVLDTHPAAGFDEVVITNDTFVLLAPLAEIERRIDPAADFWGLTGSREVSPHVQSYYVHFRTPAVRHPTFAAHWASVEPQARKATIVNNEVGMSRKLRAAGLTMDVAFHPTRNDWLVAERRALVHGWHNPRSILGQWNTNTILADAALDGRMPSVKISTLRYDPFKIGVDRLLAGLEARYPAEMDGVRAYLERTAASYA